MPEASSVEVGYGSLLLNNVFSPTKRKTNKQIRVHVQYCLCFGKALCVCVCVLGGGVMSITNNKSHKEVREAVGAWQCRDNDYT